MFSGPLKLIRWLEDYTSQWQPKDELGNILDLSARQSSAANVMLAVIAAIRAGTATYGDLSWLQEALHAYRIAGEQRGPKSSGAMIAGNHEDVVAMTVAECGSPKAVIEAVGALEKELTDAKVDWQLVAYGGAVHCFTDRGAGADPSKGCAYDAAADARSWAAMRGFFAELFARKP